MYLKDSTYTVVLSVHTGHGKPRKSWNLGFQFPGMESHGILVKVMEKRYAVGNRIDMFPLYIPIFCLKTLT